MKVDEVSEPVHAVEDLSRMFNVATKTISRWRDQGLVSRWFVVDGRRRVGFLHSSVERFVEARNQDKVNRGKRFSQLTDDEKGEIIKRARAMAANGRQPIGGDAAIVGADEAKSRNRSLYPEEFRSRESSHRNFSWSQRFVERRRKSEQFSSNITVA